MQKAARAQRILMPFLYTSLQVGAAHVLTAYFTHLDSMLGFTSERLRLTERRRSLFSLEPKSYGSRIVTRLAGAFSLARLAADRLRLQLIDDVMCFIQTAGEMRSVQRANNSQHCPHADPLEFSCGG